MNVVTLQGRIANIYNARHISIVKLIINKIGGEDANIVQVRFTRNEQAMLFDFEVGDFVTITGTVKVEMIKENEDDKPSFNQYIRGLWIGLAKNELSTKFDLNVKGHYKSINECLLSGKVITVSKIKKNVCSFLIRPIKENFNISITQFADSPEFLINKYAGKNICAICEIQSKKKEYDGEIKHFQNIIIKEANTFEDNDAYDKLPFN